METLEHIEYLAKNHASHGRPKRQEDMDEGIPYFEIRRDAITSRFVVKGYNYEWHDNAPRMGLWEAYMNTKVLPLLHRDLPIAGWYNIELHDSYTYLSNDPSRYQGVFTFSRFKSDKHPILIPDPYAMQQWGGQLAHFVDPVPWERKLDQACFFGTTTGNRKATANQRIQMCLWARERPSLTFKITNIAQMTEQSVREACGSETVFQSILSPPISPQDQCRFKYHVVLDGNTCRFDIWNYLSNSVTLKHESKEMLWYYPMMRDGEHFFKVQRNTLEGAMHVDSTTARRVTDNAKGLCKTLMQPHVHAYYTAQLFENIAFQA